MATINYDIIGDNNFLRKAEYNFYIFNFLKEFEDKFQLANKVEIEFKEVINPDPNKPTPNELIVSEGDEEIKLIYKTSRFFTDKGGLSKPDENSFFKGFKFYFENTVIKEDNQRFEELNTNQEEE